MNRINAFAALCGIAAAAGGPACFAQTSQSTYAYDALGRLQSADYGGAGKIQYGLDPNGNRFAVIVSAGVSGPNVILGGLGNDTLTGTAGADHIFGFDGDDTLNGSSGNDLLEGGKGTNILTGGSGTDLAAYTSSYSDLWVDLAAGAHADTGTWDVFVDLEGIQAGNGSDSVFGDSSANTLLGGSGNDTIIGRGGIDWVSGGAGNDWLDGGDGNDRLVAGGGVDYLIGGTGDDVFDCGASVWSSISDFASGDHISLGGYVFSGSVVGDYDGDGQADDTLLGFAAGNIVVLNISSYSLSAWNSLLVA